MILNYLFSSYSSLTQSPAQTREGRADTFRVSTTTTMTIITEITSSTFFITFMLLQNQCSLLTSSGCTTKRDAIRLLRLSFLLFSSDCHKRPAD